MYRFMSRYLVEKGIIPLREVWNLLSIFLHLKLEYEGRNQEGKGPLRHLPKRKRDAKIALALKWSNFKFFSLVGTGASLIFYLC